LSEGEVRGDRVKVTAQVARFIQVADQEGRQHALSVGDRAQPDLGGEALGKRLSGPESGLPVLVLRMVVHRIAVSGRRIVEVGIEVKVLAGFPAVVVEPIGAVVLVLVFTALLKGGVGLQLLLDARFQLERRHLQQLHQLNLLGTQLLLELLL